MMLLYILYLWLRTFILFIQRIFLKSISRKPRDQRAQCMRIIGRKKPHPLMIASRLDFVGLHKGFRLPQCVLAEDVSLYSIDGTTATFVRMPPDVPLYTPGGDMPYMYVSQFKNAQTLIEMPLEVFCQVAGALPIPKSPVVLLFSTAESGCSVLADALFSTGQVKMLWEPDALTNLIHAPVSELDPALMTRVLDATLRYLVRHNNKNLGHLIKTRSDVSKMLPAIHAAAPWVRHLFAYSSPLEQICSAMAAFEKTPLRTLWKTPQGKAMIFETNPDMGKALDKHVNSYFTATGWMWAQPVAAYLAARNKGIPVSAVWYQDMVMDPEGAFDKVWRHCGYGDSLELAPGLLANMKNKLSWLEARREQAMEKYSHEYSGQGMADIDAITDMVGVPRVQKDLDYKLLGTLVE